VTLFPYTTLFRSKEIFSKPDVDGGLIGGAALKADDFLTIVNGF
jgi:triosephosphate isomerase